MRRVLSLAIIAAALLLPGQSCAQSTTPNCVLGAIAPIVFGNYSSVSGSHLDFTTSVTVNCTRMVPGGTERKVSIRVDLSAGTFGTVAQRRMGSALNRLNYNLFKDPARTILWGNGTGSPGGVSETFNLAGSIGTVTSRTYVIYGRLPAGQSGTAIGAYLDSIVASLFAVIV